MNKAGASVADAKLEQTNAAVQVLLQQVAQLLVASANLPAAANVPATNEAFAAAVSGLQNAINAVGGAPVDLSTATSASTGRLVTAMATKATATAKASQVLNAISTSFGNLSPTSVAAAIAATPLPDLVNAVGSATSASLTTQGGAETVAASASQMGTVMQQVSTLLTDNADAGSVAVTTLTNLIGTLLPSSGVAPTQAAADTAIANAVSTINAALPPGNMPVTPPAVPVQPPIVMPKR